MRKLLLLTALLFYFTLLASAQNKSITLKLIDEKTGAPIEKAGCLTLEKEKTTGTLSGKDGIFTVKCVGDSIKLSIHHIKYKTKVLKITPQNDYQQIKLEYNNYEIERQKNIDNKNPTLLKTLDNKRFIKGKIIDAETGEPMEDATILICGTNTGAVSNAAGEFTIPHWFKNDDIVLEISYMQRHTEFVKIHTKTKMVTIPNPIKLVSIVNIF